MPEFVDLFVKFIRKYRDMLAPDRSLKLSIMDDVRGTILDCWNEVPDLKSPSFEAVAVDSSTASRKLSDGSIIHLSRAMALPTRGKPVRLLYVERFYYCGGSTQLSSYYGIWREYLEFTAAYKAAEELKGEGLQLVLVDGSLYGRLLHVPKDMPVEGNADLHLKFIESYWRLMRRCRKLDVWPVGISKDSRSQILKNHVLDLIFNSRIKDVEGGLQDRLKDIWFQAKIHKSRALREFQSLNEAPQWFKELFLIYMSHLPDFRLIQMISRKPGYTTPLLLGLTMHMAKRWDRLRRAESYVKTGFPRSIHGKDESYVRWAVKQIRRLLGMPAIVTTYLVPGMGDIPLRIDLPAWVVGLKDKLGDVNGLVPLDPGLDGFRKVLGAILSMYAGPKNYNVLLSRVDSRVRITRRVFDRVYERILERELDIIIAHERRYRRVKYP